MIYVSSGVRSFSDAEIRDILSVSRRNNERSGLTGMLLYRDGNFLQVLEGPESAVEATFARISKDPRHRGIIVIRITRPTSRLFSEWTMAFRDLTSDDASTLEGYNPFMEASFDSEAFRAQPEFAYRMLLQFKEKMR